MATNSDLKRWYKIYGVEPKDFVRYDDMFRILCYDAVDDFHAVNLGQVKRMLQDYEKVLNLENGTGQNSVQMNGTLANGNRSFTVGLDTIADSDDQTVVGRYNAQAQGALFVVGDGNDNEHRLNALEVYDGYTVLTDLFAHRVFATEEITTDDMIVPINVVGRGHGSVSFSGEDWVVSLQAKEEPESGDVIVYMPGENGTLLTEEKANDVYAKKLPSPGLSYGIYGNVYNSDEQKLYHAFPGSTNINWLAMYGVGGTLTCGTPKNDDEAANKKYVDDKFKNYRLIETITLTEDTKIIDRSQEPDGKAYNFKDMFIGFSCTNDMPYGNVTSDKEWAKCFFHYGNKSFAIFREVVLGRAAKGTKHKTYIKTMNEGNLKRAVMSKGYINYGYCNGETDMYGNLEWLFTTDNLTKIQLEHQSTFLAGIVIEIWATDA